MKYHMFARVCSDRAKERYLTCLGIGSPAHSFDMWVNSGSDESKRPRAELTKEECEELIAYYVHMWDTKGLEYVPVEYSEPRQLLIDFQPMEAV